MTFGLEYGDVVAHEDCPRCNAPAVIRSRKYVKAVSDKLNENNLTCPKCHYVEFVELVTYERMLDQKRLNRFKRLREKAKTRRDQRRLDERIAEVERQMSLHDVIKWPERRKVERDPVTEAESKAYAVPTVKENRTDQVTTPTKEDIGRR